MRLFYVRLRTCMLNTRQWTSLQVLSTPYVYVRKKMHHSWKTAFSLKSLRALFCYGYFLSVIFFCFLLYCGIDM